MDHPSELRNAWRQRKVLGCLPGTLGILMIGGAMLAVLNTRASMEGMQATQGTVIDYGPPDSPRKKPTVEFTVHGQRHVFTDPGKAKTPAFEIGETVEVRYDPAWPDNNARVSTFGQLYLGPVLVGLLGAALFSLYLVAWLRPPRMGRKVPPGSNLPRARQLRSRP